MKRIKNLRNKLFVGGAIVLSALNSCAPMIKTYAPPRYIGNFVGSTNLATGNALVETDSMHLVAKGNPNAQPGDSCYANFEWKSYINGPKKQSIYLTFPRTNEKHEIKGKERND